MRLIRLTAWNPLLSKKEDEQYRTLLVNCNDIAVVEPLSFTTGCRANSEVTIKIISGGGAMAIKTLEKPEEIETICNGLPAASITPDTGKVL